MGVLSLIRVRQWYKNLLIFLPLAFSGHLFIVSDVIVTIFGFIALCMVSSANYVINDLKDLKKDRKNIEKRNRPLASGKIGVGAAMAVAGLLLLFSLGIGYILDELFFMSIVSLFLLGSVYTFWLKEEAFADVILIGVNFVLRAVSGAFLIGVVLSPWLILCPFFLAIYLAVGKRRAEAAMLGKDAADHRQSLSVYSEKVTGSLMALTTSLLLISYSLYSFLSVQNRALLLTIPVVMYGVLRFNYLVETGSVVARHPEKMIGDRRLMASLLIWSVLVFAILYRSSVFLSL